MVDLPCLSLPISIDFVIILAKLFQFNSKRMDIEQLKYPIGKYNRPEVITGADINKWIDEIATLPEQLCKTVDGLSEQRLATPYREGGWTVRQVLHHVPDSHLQAYVRFKLALTEEAPTIKPYREDRWAMLPDSEATPVDVSLTILEALHKRWVFLLKSMSMSDFKRTFYHPEHQKEFALDGILGMYAWHGKHHLAHIQNLKERMKW